MDSPLAAELMKLPKVAERAYVPRKIHVDWDTVHHLIGQCSFIAWCVLVKKYNRTNLRSDVRPSDLKYFKEHKAAISRLMRAACVEIISGAVDAALAEVPEATKILGGAR